MYTRFFITCAARTGSTMLRYLLDGHPEICCHGEVFVRKGLLRFIFKNRRSFGLSPGYTSYERAFQQTSLSDFLSTELFSDSKNHKKAVGFKFKTDEFFDPGYIEIADYLKLHTEMKVIHLRRKDLLAQYVSYLFVQKKLNPTVSFDPNSERSTKQIRLDRKLLYKYFALITEREIKIEQALHNHQMHRVWYEDLIGDREFFLGEIFDFLGVQKMITPSTTQKLIVNYQDHITNLEEVYSWLSQSEYAARMSINPER